MPKAKNQNSAIKSALIIVSGTIIAALIGVNSEKFKIENILSFLPILQNHNESYPFSQFYNRIEVGRKYLRQQKIHLAKSKFEEAQKINTKHPLPDFYLGYTHEQKVNLNQLHTYYENAANKYIAIEDSAKELRSFDYDALVRICHFFNRYQNPALSLELSSIALEIEKISDKKKYGAYACRGTSLFLLNRNDSDLSEAEHYFLIALDIQKSPIIHYNLGSLYARFDNYDKAEWQYQEALSLFASANEFLGYIKKDLGFLYIVAEELEKAQEILEELKQFFPHPDINRGLEIIKKLKIAPHSSSNALLERSNLNIFRNLIAYDHPEQDIVLNSPPSFYWIDENDRGMRDILTCIAKMSEEEKEKTMFGVAVPTPRSPLREERKKEIVKFCYENL